MLPLEQVANQRPGVHVAWFGLRRTEHTMEPLRLLGATSCFLLEAETDAARANIEDAGGSVNGLFADINVPMQSIITNIWDAGCVAGCIGAISDALADAGGANVAIHVNVSVGPRPAAIGAGLAGMFWDVRLFHPGGANPDQALTKAANAIEMPCLKATLPGRVERLILGALATGEGRTTGAGIKARLRANTERRGPGRTPAGEHNEISRAITKLEQMGAVRRPTGQHQLVVEATPSGMALVRMFEQYDATRALLRRSSSRARAD